MKKEGNKRGNERVVEYRLILLMLITFLLPLFNFSGELADAQPVGTVTTFAGSAGNSGSADGTGSEARFYSPRNITIAEEGTLFVSDHFNHTIRRITPAAEVTTYAGTVGVSGYLDTIPPYSYDTMFDRPRGITIATDGTLFVCDHDNHVIRNITPAAEVYTFAGTPQPDIPPTLAAPPFIVATGITIAADGTLFVCDSFDHVIYKITPAAEVTTYAGTVGVPGYQDSCPPYDCEPLFNGPYGITIATDGTLFVTESANHTIRKITPSGVVTTFAGSAGNSGSADGTGSEARFYAPGDITISDDGTLFVCDGGNHTIRRITPAAEVTTYAGSAGNPGVADGIGSMARFDGPRGITISDDGSILFVVDTINHTIRKVTVFTDEDEDGVPDSADNCPNTPNTNQLDTYPPGGNEIGDACDCEADFTCDGDVDADDVTTFLEHFGREAYYLPCTSGDPCIGDFICDADVDADDVTLFLEDFGREEYYNPCPACVEGDWCVYP